MPVLFIISGCNGAGKTTASFTILPELLNIKEFVNADEIARGLSPFQPHKVAIEAGKIMLNRLNDLILKQEDFALETTLSGKSFIEFITKAKRYDYSINLIYYWLDSEDLAIERVKMRVSEGGHNIANEIVIRRYYTGLKNLINLYKNKVDYWLVIDNSKAEPEVIAESQGTGQYQILNRQKWTLIQNLATHDE